MSVCLYCFLLLLFHESQSQCNPPGQLPTVECSENPLYCFLNACYSTSNAIDPGQAGFCGNNTSVHNPQYFQIIPIANNIEIHIRIDNCEVPTAALQSALVSSCDWLPCPGGVVPCADVLDCNSGQGIGGTMKLSASGLTPGQPVWLLIDGSSGSRCQYTFIHAEGIFEPEITGEITSGKASPEIVCQGYNHVKLTAGPSIPNAHGYLWVMGWNGSIVTSTLPQTEINIPSDAPPGIWDICVQAFSGCDTTLIPLCFPIRIVEGDFIERPSAIFCPEEFPIVWNGIIISEPGVYHSSSGNTNECRDTAWTIESFANLTLNHFEYTVQGLKALFEAGNEDFSQFNWDFGDGVKGTGSNPQHTYNNPGFYNVQLIGISQCSMDTISQQIRIGPSSDDPPRTLLLTPNDDNVNDVLVIQDLEDFPDAELTIVNRWGNVVFNARPYFNNWDGRGPEGKLLAEGTYYFMLRNAGSNIPSRGAVVIIH